MARSLLQMLLHTMTQSAANTFTESSINTNIIAPDGMLIKQVEFELSSVQDANGEGIDIQLSKDSKSSMEQIDDPDIIAKINTILTVVTSGGNEISKIKTIRIPPPGIVVVRDQLFMAINSASMSAALTARTRIYYEKIKLSSAEALLISR